MQSQQKKVKWSRGETADALEERTDTGITQVSVSKLENIIADVYGNISRRPAFKTITSVVGATDIPVISGTTHYGNSSFLRPPQSFVFTVDANTYIIFIADPITGAFGGLLIQHEKFVKRVTITNTTTWSPLSWTKQISAAQYNNFMVVSNLYVGDVIFRLTETNDVTVEKFQFDAPWYAPGATITSQVTDNEITGLEFDASTIENYTYTTSNGITTVYSSISTGLSASALTNIWTGPTTTYYYGLKNDQFIISTDNTGITVVGSVTITNGQTLTNGQVLHSYGINELRFVTDNGGKLVYYAYLYVAELDVSENVQITNPFIGYIPLGSIIQFPNNGAYMRVEGFDTKNSKLLIYGPFLTPIADKNAKDKIVKIESGYVSLNDYMPTQFAFSNQRLYAAGFYTSDGNPQQIPGYAVGSQIARYNDFKNDYNTQSEAIVIDISTAYQEQIVAMIDYNGLKLLTDAAEYAYTAQGVIKQSENGTLATCKPLVFGSVCLYADKSGGQIRAMQYEFQSDLFSSSSINQMAKEDLVFNTTTMAGHLDKEHFAGRFLYTTQQGYDINGNARADHALAVCNMVPGNQAMIWGRWTTPEVVTPNGQSRHSIVNAIEVNNKIWFVMACEEVVPGQGFTFDAYTLAELDYDSVLDGETTATDTEYRIVPAARENDMFAWTDQNDPTNTVYTHDKNVLQGDNIYDADNNIITTADNSPGGPNIVIGGVGYYAWAVGASTIYTKSAKPEPTGPTTDESRKVYDENGNALPNRYLLSYNSEWDQINVVYGTSMVETWPRLLSGTSLEYTYLGTQYTADRDTTKDVYITFATIPGATVSVFDGDEFKWNDTLDEYGIYTKPLTDLQNPRIGFMINATLESHPIDIQGKTYTEKKRIGKAVAVVRDTNAGAFTVCDKTGYMSPDKKSVNFYGCTGMKDLIRYTIKNKQGAKFTIESLTMIIEHGTLDS